MSTDLVSLKRLQELHPLVRAKGIDAYNEAVKITPVGIHPYINEVLRSFERSAKLYAQGRTEPGDKVSNAKAGQSYHNYGLALDFNIQVNGKTSWNVDHNWMVVVNVFKKHGFKWGGDWKSFKDYPHLEMTFGYTTAQLLAKHKAGDFIAGTNYVRL